MVVKEDGTKWACQSCLKGHRVSGCTHTDRELTLVPKKGRPVTQCQHCRLERKKRSAHVKCECAEVDRPHHPKEKCIHLREAEERAKGGHHEDHHSENDAVHLATVAEEQGCCCHHGGKCSCAILRKDTDESTGVPHGPAVKPRLEKTTSDGAITVFTNGHHKPVHRKNHAAHECGMPYKLPTPRSITDSSTSSAARRSCDSLALERQMSHGSVYNAAASISSSVDRQHSLSEQHSPKMIPLGAKCNGRAEQQVPPMDFYGLAQTQTNSSVQSYTSEMYASPLDAMSGTTDSSFDPWSAFPSGDTSVMPNNNPFGVWPTQHDANSISQPALTSASSGSQSEVDEMPLPDEAYGYPMPSIQEDSNSDTINAPSDMSPQSNRRSLPPGFFGNATFGNPELANDWSNTMNGFNPAAAAKLQQSNLSASFDDSYQLAALSPFMSVPQRAIGNGVIQASRPQSRSVGSTSAPNDDIIKQLFPDLDLNSGMFGAPGSPPMSSDVLMSGSSQSNAAAEDYGYGPMDEEVGFTSQSWSDGSMSVPMDSYTTSCDLESDFSNPDFSGNWSQ